MKRFLLLFAVCAAGSALAQETQYPGPTILSRGLGTVLQGGGDLLRLRPYLSLSGVYETGLIPVAVDQSGKVPQDSAYGGHVEGGVTGYHMWRRTLLGLDYRGNVRHYSRRTYFDGSDHTLMLGVTHEVSRRLSVSVREAAGTRSRNTGFFSGYTFFDPAFSDIPTDELFNGRTNYLSSMGDLTYTPTQRLSFNMGGTSLLVRRRSAVLVGLTGYIARGDMQYRLGRSVSIGADYNFTHYGFTRSFGASDIHTVAFDLATQLGRRWDLGLRIGGARLETLGLQRVAVDPIIAAITGVTSGVEVMYRLNYLPSGSIKLSRAFRRSTFSLTAESDISPGNGVYLTSRQQSAGIGYSHTASRRWNLGLSAGYTTYSSMMSTMGKYSSPYGGGGVTCRLNEWMHLVGRYDVRRHDVRQSAYGRRIAHSASLGIAFSPGEFPLSLW